MIKKDNVDVENVECRKCRMQNVENVECRKNLERQTSKVALGADIRHNLHFILHIFWWYFSEFLTMNMLLVYIQTK